MAQILDYSAGYPGAAAVRNAGFEGVIRYLRKEGTSSVRPITAGEFADMRAHGRTVALVYQHVSKARPTDGRAAGRHDAQWALARARDIGVDPRCIYMAVDFDADPASVREYFIGAADVLRIERVGGYGGFRVLARLFDDGLISKGWQTAAWSAGRREGRAHLFQRIGQVTVGGISCDVNDVLKPDYGQIGGDDMGYADDVLQWMQSERLNKLPPGHRFTGKVVGDMLLDATDYAAQSRDIAARLEVQLAALAGTLADDEASIIAAVRQIVADDENTEVVLGPEQYEQLLAALPPVVADGLREAFARAGTT